MCVCEREREMFYLRTHSTHFIYGYMASDIWLRTILIVRKETCCRHIGYSYRLTARVLVYAPSHRQDNTYHGLCYTSCGALAGTRSVCVYMYVCVCVYIYIYIYTHTHWLKYQTFLYNCLSLMWEQWIIKSKIFSRLP